MSQLIGIPLKKTLQIDLYRQLGDVIDSTFYQVSSIFADDLAKVNKMREVLLTSEVSEKNLEKLKKYCNYVFCLIAKFPDKQIEFTWFESLGHKSFGKSSSLFKFELLNVVYNIGAMYSLLALDYNDGSQEGLKKSCKCFQESAGCFQYILDSLDNELGVLLEEKSLTSLLYLSLAEAQEQFWFKAVQDKLKNSLIAMLAMQVSIFYEESYQYAKTSPIIKTDMVRQIRDKYYYFCSVAYYRNALYFNEKEEYGNAIRSLKEAQQNISSAGQSPYCLTLQKELNDMVRISERDNDLIYLQVVPDSCPVIKPAVMVKALIIDELSSYEKSWGIFKNLLPIDVTEGAAAFNIRQDKYVENYIKDPLMMLNKFLNDKLPENELPSEIKHLTEEDWNVYSKSLSDMAELSKLVEQKVQEVEGLLQQEQNNETEMRNLYGTMQWNLSRSKELNATFKNRISKIKEYITQGREITNETTKLLNMIDKKIVTTEIKLPESDDPIVRKVGKVTKERYDYIHNIEQKSLTNRILPKLVTHYKNTGSLDFEDIFHEHLKLFQQDLLNVQSEKQRNEELIQELSTKKNDETSTTNISNPRHIYIQELKYSMHLLDEVKGNIEEGFKFYGDLNDSIVKLRNDVHDFVTQRKVEHDKFQSKIQKN
ncbi:Rim20p Ecym_6232 [Eremothecium cymbalariae DBVPG|uniref:BRO1 domain-containing protein n=1 Tax=Eremothecium cymbalariae (strain CBS 270.75 / DBVPG 7215 / KCTC 17166 / NRRL Y-17582) TaxID=931890 RepID=G8JVD5_ERECY|nr:hypothetical protein Ecym_6232 [Eremothecium cymbalariae DBVPG\